MKSNSIRLAAFATVIVAFSAFARAGDKSRTRDKFDEAYTKYKEIVKECADLQDRFPIADPNDRPAMAKHYENLVAAGNLLRPTLLALAEKTYVENPADKQIADMVFAAVATFIHNDDYEEALRLSKLLIDNKYSDQHVYNLAGAAAFFTSDYDDAEKYLRIANENGTLDEKGQEALGKIKDYRAKWDREQKFRAAEAKADDLPRVKLTIGDAKGNAKGEIVVELFENEAPNTVANFISLVKKGYYDGTPFHRVLPGFMAQGGDPTGSGQGGPGYRIADECYQPNHREHFRGSLSMAHTSERDSGGSQFFMCFVPKESLDGGYTVFGRVISGIDELAKIQRVDPDQHSNVALDKIIKAEVLRARPHAYEPKTLKGT